MPPRALVIGIEQYPQATDLAPTIAGATNNAEAFFAWVTKVKGIAPADAYVCAAGGTFPGGRMFGTARETIVDAVAALVAAGQDQTDELYVYFSGHGYGFQDSPERRAVDVLVGGDYQNAAAGGVKCLKLQELQEKLWSVLGGAHHYYFIDACRNLIADDAIDPIGLGRVLGRPASRGRPTKYTLYSTAYGTTARINSGFGPALLDGLNGKGDAKGFTPNGALYVMFALLCNYVQTKIRPQAVDQSKDGNGDGYIVEVNPVPTYACSIQVLGAAPADQFTVTLHPPGDATLSRTATFTGGSFSVPFRPGSYVVEVFAGHTALSRLLPPPSESLSFWDDCAATFTIPSAAASAPPPPGASTPAPPPSAAAAPPPPPPAASASAPSTPTATPEPLPGHALISVVSLPSVAASATDLRTGKTQLIDANGSQNLPPGDYEVTVSEDDVPIERQMRTLKAGSTLKIGADQLDPIRASIAQAVGGLRANGAVEFSETLGPMLNRDLGLWLTILGASRIVRDPGTFSEMRGLPLADVTTFAPNTCGVYFLGALADTTPPGLEIGGVPLPAQPVATLQGVYQAMWPSIEGAQLVSVTLGSAQPRTFASWCLPNRLTLFVCSPGSRGQLRVNQFILPMFHLVNNLDPKVRGLVADFDRPLRVVRSAYLFQAAFGAKRAIAPVTDDDQGVWDSLLNGKWIDPLMSVLACYEILRRGDDRNKQDVSDIVLKNLNLYFAGIPDIAAIAAQLQRPQPLPHGAPLFREGLLALPELEPTLPMPVDRLDYNHIWTAWRGALGR